VGLFYGGAGGARTRDQRINAPSFSVVDKSRICLSTNRLHCQLKQSAATAISCRLLSLASADPRASSSCPLVLALRAPSVLRLAQGAAILNFDK
jgi:hypothetical protein